MRLQLLNNIHMKMRNPRIPKEFANKRRIRAHTYLRMQNNNNNNN